VEHAIMRLLNIGTIGLCDSGAVPPTGTMSKLINVIILIQYIDEFKMEILSIYLPVLRVYSLMDINEMQFASCVIQNICYYLIHC
jgi:hypothetical protein